MGSAARAPLLPGRDAPPTWWSCPRGPRERSVHWRCCTTRAKVLSSPRRWWCGGASESESDLVTPPAQVEVPTAAAHSHRGSRKPFAHLPATATATAHGARYLLRGARAAAGRRRGVPERRAARRAPAARVGDVVHRRLLRPAGLLQRGRDPAGGGRARCVCARACMCVFVCVRWAAARTAGARRARARGASRLVSSCCVAAAQQRGRSVRSSASTRQRAGVWERAAVVRPLHQMRAMELIANSVRLRLRRDTRAHVAPKLPWGARRACR